MGAQEAMERQALFIFDENETAYRFSDEHPFNQKRLLLTVDLLRRAGALPASCQEPPMPVDPEKLCTVHAKEYVEAVIALSHPMPDEAWMRRAATYGLDTEDTPFFHGMHEATSTVVGGSVQAVDAVMTGRTPHALHLGGGLHHALSGKGAGFCVYNDASVAIEHAKCEYGARVLYIDTDVHHGDGVQWSFYTDPDVCTFSIHETGKYLFPGTGAVQERGEDSGFGTTVNVPVEPYTEDESWLECFGDVLVKVIDQFKPDLIVSQHGCDAHAFDPLAHVHCSMEIYRAMPALIHRLAHEYCEGRWVALGGGGYDIWRVVPRAWSLLWLEMTDHPLRDALQADAGLPLPEDWVTAWQPFSEEPLPPTWLDPVHTWTPMPRRAEITAKNRQTKEIAMLYLK
ncbi:acetoin utilization protein AcuC [Paenibacillus mucilaginosus]|uniref:Acetoin utilization protein AcuC n=1 Tax=Paenibacillus mucilaginosus (strain KNP414) TaxID=1036673 RepID=F8F901_PAEMK|nr:acetoin utilization protein AcuC [Paenibacillus mucilaginosus]AEI42449.1 Acetoin utilization protein AcuC [Paenibacillus mucilaginosus KNP414]MCG7213849.1 acetoin utilization protein AcuC [Paenibacillus mucilaginosus]WDM25857.1 acetoin utilization protein AcuC [Paenibacillus mucilaginosus]